MRAPSVPRPPKEQNVHVSFEIQAPAERGIGGHGEVIRIKSAAGEELLTLSGA
jgi:hypothetical protein